MIMEGKFSVKAQLKPLWDMLFSHVENVAACMPGVQLEKAIDDKTFALIMKQKVGPFNMTMKGPVVLTTVAAPTHLDMDGEFVDVMKLGQLKTKINLDLKRQRRKWSCLTGWTSTYRGKCRHWAWPTGS